MGIQQLCNNIFSFLHIAPFTCNNSKKKGFIMFNRRSRKSPKCFSLIDCTSFFCFSSINNVSQRNRVFVASLLCVLLIVLYQIIIYELDFNSYFSDYSYYVSGSKSFFIQYINSDNIYLKKKIQPCSTRKNTREKWRHDQTYRKSKRYKRFMGLFNPTAINKTFDHDYDMNSRQNLTQMNLSREGVDLVNPINDSVSTNSGAELCITFDIDDIFSLNNDTITKKLHPDGRIIVLAAESGQNLLDLLRSLSEAHFGSELAIDRVDLDIWIDYSKVSNKIDTTVVEVGKTFTWEYGKKDVHIRHEFAGIHNQWIYTWDTETLMKQNRREIIAILHENASVSPWFYVWLKAAHKMYASRNEIAGFSLDNSIECPMQSCDAKFKIVNIGLIQHTFVQATGFSPTIEHWHKFQYWLKKSRASYGTLNPSIKKLKQSEKFRDEARSRKCPGVFCSWEAFHEYYAYLNLDSLTVYHTSMTESLLRESSMELIPFKFA